MSDSSHSEAAGAPRGEKPPGLFERLRALFGFEDASGRDNVEEAIAEASREGTFSPQELLILKNVMALRELRVADIKVPRAYIVAVEIEQPLTEVLQVFRTAAHSRLPVYAETLDDPRGMVHIRDFVDYLAKAAETRGARTPATSEGDNMPAIERAAARGGIDLSLPLARADILRPVLYAPPSMPALDLLVRMQASRTHMALVVDEYGGTDGLVSIEDIMETIVGNIEDEHDEAEAPHVDRAPDGSYLTNARTPLEAVAEAIGQSVGDDLDVEDVDTIGGLLAAIAGRVPVRGEVVRITPTLEAEVIDADPRRVKRVKLRVTASPATP